MMITNTFKIIFQFITSLLLLWIVPVTAIPRKIKRLHRLLVTKDLIRTPREISEAELFMTCNLRLPSKIDMLQNCFFIVPLTWGVFSWASLIITFGLAHQTDDDKFISEVWPYMGFTFGFKLAPPIHLIYTIHLAVQSLRDDPYPKELVTEQALFLKGQILSFFQKDNFYELEAVREDFEKDYQKVISDNVPITNEKLLIAIASFTKRGLLTETSLLRNRHKDQRKFTFDALMECTPLPEAIADLVLNYSDNNPIRLMESKPTKLKSSQPKKMKEDLEALSHIITMPVEEEIEFEIEIEDGKDVEKKPLLTRRVINL